MNGNDIRATVHRGFPLLLAAAFLPAPMRLAAADALAVDTSHWVCKFCPFEEGHSASVELGAGYLSDDSFKFGEYTGLTDQGGFVVANAAARYRKGDGSWFDLALSDLGIDSRSFRAQGGRQGRYRLSLGYQELPHNIADTGRTPFLGVGTAALTLPSSWIPATTTGSMSSLTASLHGIELQTRRRAVDFGGDLTSVVNWEFAARFRHETKTGTLATAGTFVFNSAQLGMPVDYDTNQMDLSAAYSGSRLQARLAYYGSIFSNDDEALTWANPYVPLAAGAGLGRRALAPGNQFHQLVASAGFKLGQRTHATANIAFGRMTQDEAFLPYTVNSSLTTQPLPRSSLGGQVNTLSGHLNLTSAVTDRLRVNAAFNYDDRDNRTPQALYEWVTTDVNMALPRTNLPYSSTHSVARLDGGFALTRDLRVDAGCDYDQYRRDLQEVSRTRETNCWARATARAGSRADIMLKGAHAERTISDYTANPEIVSPENPLLRKYNMADRDRDTGGMRVDLTLGAGISAGLEASVSRDDYRNSVIGLLYSRSLVVAADAGFSLSANTSATLYLSHEQIESNQANAELLPGASLWFASNKDSTDTAGAGVKHHAGDKLDLGADYTFARSNGEISIRSATLGFPDLTSRLNSVRLHATFRPQKRLPLRLSYWYEDYSSRDWTVDGVTPATIPNVLSLGQGSPSYHLSVVTLSGRYEF